MLKHLYRHLIPSPAALTFLWIGIAVFLISAAFLTLYAILEADLFSFLVGLSAFSFSGLALMWVIASFRDHRAAPRAWLWSGATMAMFLGVIATAIAMRVDQPAEMDVSWLFLCCCSPGFLFPGAISLFLWVRAWPELNRLVRADRAQRAIELISARGEATYLEIGKELGIPEQQAEALIEELSETGRIAVILDPANRRVYTLIALLEKQRRLLAVVQARGQIHLDELGEELRAPRQLLRKWIYNLVRRDKFSGYVDWEAGMLYSREVEELATQTKCPNCGGEVDLAGKGVIRCGYCGIEIFLPREALPAPAGQLKIGLADLDRRKIPGLMYGEVSLEPAALTENRFQRLRALLMPSKRAIRALIVALVFLILGSLCIGTIYLTSESAEGIELSLFGMGFFVFPLTVLIMAISALLERRNPPRTLLWAAAASMIGLAGAILTGLMFIDPEAGFELSGYSIIIFVAPVVVLFSLPAVYFGFKSWPEVSAVLRLQLRERALRLIETRGEIGFGEMAETLEIPINEVGALVDELLRSGRLKGTMDAAIGRVYTDTTLAEKRAALLAFVQAGGQVGLDEMAAHLDAPLYKLRDWIYQLVQLGQFNGYINWEEGLLYSLAAEKLGAATQCPHCGGELGLVEAEIIRCQYCAAEIYRSVD